MRDLPGSHSEFKEIVSENRIYVDKTEFVYNILDNRDNNSYFLSRPHGFGKTILVSTLEAILQGRRELFQDLLDRRLGLRLGATSGNPFEPQRNRRQLH